MNRAAVACGLAALACLAVPAIARAGIATVIGSTLHVNAAAGETNLLLFRQVAAPGGSVIRVEDGAFFLNAGAGCTQQNQTTVECRVVPRVEVRTGDQGDSVAVDSVNPGAAVSPSIRFLIDPGPGDDLVLGGRGNDLIMASTDADDLRGGPGVDTVSYAGRADSVTADIEAIPTPPASYDDGNLLDGSPGARDSIDSTVEGLIGGDAGDTLIGNGAANSLAGGPGADRLRGLAGGDSLDGGPALDKLFGGPGNDRLTGGRGRDFLFGEVGLDLLLARDGTRDGAISCGPGANRREGARVDRRDPRPRSC